MLLVQSSSAAAERVFLIVANSFSSQQEAALENYIQLSVMFSEKGFLQLFFESSCEN